MYDYKIVKFVNNEISLDVNVSPNEETVWLTANQMAKLFDRDASVIRKHIRNILKSKELYKDSTRAFFARRSSDSTMASMIYYNLDMIISVGYRVNSQNGVIFRKWATKVLKEYLLKGFAISNRATITRENYINLTNKVIELDKDVNYLKQEIKIINPETQIFYSGEYFKSYVFINKILKEPNKKLVIIDPYMDSSIFAYLKFVDKKIKCILIYSNKSKISSIEIDEFKKKDYKIVTYIDGSFHDRFIVIDSKTIYHIGTSLNYLGNKTFLISKVNDEIWAKKFIKNINSKH